MFGGEVGEKNEETVKSGQVYKLSVMAAIKSQGQYKKDELKQR